ncbi:hypothetical protein EYF80_038574 [Liparis tanakae]|uniref:Uncharacterized protein n=1 Tax=Liparis tanakae TaxID=230148 RepID=A0A4Z2GEW0_9TELE|nr:hypothetical protein EYF80_038574 [Liparis tanakae]
MSANMREARRRGESGVRPVDRGGGLRPPALMRSLKRFQFLGAAVPLFEVDEPNPQKGRSQSNSEVPKAGDTNQEAARREQKASESRTGLSRTIGHRKIKTASTAARVFAAAST